MCVKFKENPIKNNSRQIRMEKHIYITKKHSCGFIFSKPCNTLNTSFPVNLFHFSKH